VEIYGYVWDNFKGYHIGISFGEMNGISRDILGYLFRKSFQRYVEKRYTESPKISYHTLPYLTISQDIPRYPMGRTPRWNPPTGH
jgi:hypothetical protein